MKHARHKRWSEDAQMIVGGIVTVAIIVAAIIVFTRLGPKEDQPTATGATLRLER